MSSKPGRQSAPSEKPESPLCAACGKGIPPGAPVGGTPDRVLHLDCYLAERENKRPLKRSE